MGGIAAYHYPPVKGETQIERCVGLRLHVLRPECEGCIESPDNRSCPRYMHEFVSIGYPTLRNLAGAI
ncbi:MAG: hypothetical protein WC796_05875 [Candidatus Pacearchaeota archaeon]|jgi:hypothetical protein